jgi:DNA-binding CsgD family transcriptional regulator
MSTHAMPQARLAELQTRLRDRLLDRRYVERKECRDLAARLLLYIDDTRAMFDACLDWLNESLQSDRADAGFVVKGASHYIPCSQRLQAVHADMPSVLGIGVPLADSMVTAALLSRIPLSLNDIRLDRRLHPAMREQLLGSGVRHKLSVALRAGTESIGLLCLDRGAEAPRWDEAAREMLHTVAHGLLEPIFREMLGAGHLRPVDEEPPIRASDPALTAAEKRVAGLVLQGCSYKEIARQLGRSRSTIDHQLRSLRAKLGVHSTPKLHGALLRIQHELLPAAGTLHN